jgi:copper chaperone
MKMEQKTLNVEGMSCEHCVKAVSNAIGGITGVEDVTVSLKDKTASFKYDPAITLIEAIITAITDEGFEVV